MNSISSSIIGVPDQTLSPFCLDNHVENLRRALPAIELQLGDALAWELYADLSPIKTLEIAKTTYGKRLTDPQGSLFS